MSVRLLFKAWVAAIFWVYGLTVTASAQQEPIEVIEDNSFLIEEAYNQEPGVVQHIFQSRLQQWPEAARLGLCLHPGMADIRAGSPVFLHRPWLSPDQ